MPRDLEARLMLERDPAGVDHAIHELALKRRLGEIVIMIPVLELVPELPGAAEACEEPEGFSCRGAHRLEVDVPCQGGDAVRTILREIDAAHARRARHRDPA